MSSELPDDKPSTPAPRPAPEPSTTGEPDAVEEQAATDAPSAPLAPEIHEVQVRRAPRYATFLVTGAVVGLIVGGLIGFFGERSPTYSLFSVLGFFAVTTAIVGALLGGILALVIDRGANRRAIRAQVEEVDDDEAG